MDFGHARRHTQIKKLALVLTTVLTLAGKASALVDPDATQATKDLYALLQTLNSENGAAFGNQYALFRGLYSDGSPWYYTNADGEYQQSDIQNICGIQPAVSGWDINEFALPSSSTWWRDANIDSIIKASEKGVICTLSFHEPNPVTGGGYNDTNISLSDILPGGSHHAEFAAHWAKAADAIAALVRTDGTPVPVLLRPFHENSGGWFWWGTNTDKEHFKELWRWVVTYLRDTRGLHNILYVYNTDVVYTKTAYLDRWPGDDYVDVASVDVYTNKDADVTRLITPVSIAVQVAEEKGIPAALAETGCSNGGLGATSVTDWWTTQILKPLRDADLFRHIAFIASWATWGGNVYFVAYPGCKDAPDFRNFLRSDEILLLDRINPNAVWTKHARLGWIETEKYPWVYSTNHGWEYMYGIFNPKNADDWLYDYNLGWLWTDRNLYPTFWSSEQGYLYYNNTTETGLRWFYRYADAKWISVPQSQ